VDRPAIHGRDKRIAIVNEPNPSPPPCPKKQRRRWLRRGAFLLGLTLLSLLGAGLTVSLCGPRTYHWQAFDIKLAIHPAAHGQTRLSLPPLGTVSAATHRAPLALDLTLSGLSLEKIQALARRSPSKNLLERDLARAARTDLKDFVRRQIGWGVLGGLLGPLFLHLRQIRYWFFGALVGGGAVAILLFATYRTFDTQAFSNLTYTGSLRQAASVLGLARTAFDNAQRLSDRLRGVAGELNTLYGRISAVSDLGTPDGPTVRILHITDIHNNGLAVGFVRELARRFQVDAVIDTGDLTDFGSPVEGALSHGLAQIAVPTLFVAGNHDSQATVRAERAAPRTTVLDGQLVTVDGLTVLGEPDPSSARQGVGSVDTSDAALTAAATRLGADITRLPSPPDIVCVHNPRQAADVLGRVPLVLCGHTHTALIQKDGVTVVCNAGTTGGAGTRYFDKPGGVPLTAAILTFSQGPHPRLLFIDQVTLAGSLDEFSVTRRAFPVSVDSSLAAAPPT
jgi:predicted phosphodiesterase